MPKKGSQGAVKTPYGNVDRQALDKLRGQYDTMGLIKTIDELDELTAEARGEDGMRDMLLRLHAMTHTVINGAGINVPVDSESLPELAQELTSQISSAISVMQRWIKRIEPLETLASDDDDF